MYRLTLLLTCALAIVACGSQADPAAATPDKPLVSGVILENFDKDVRPQDDFFQYVNGAWLKTAVIPSDKSADGSFIELFDESEKNLRAIIEDSANQADRPAGSPAQQVGDFYTSYMNTTLIEQLGIGPIAPELALVDGLTSKEGMPTLFAAYGRDGIRVPFGITVRQDAKDSTTYILHLSQSGLGLPDRSYYENEDQKFVQIRASYLDYIEKLLGLAGIDEGAARAKRIMALETALAGHQWTRVQNRDRDKTYNKMKVAEIQASTPHFSWQAFIQACSMPAIEELVVRQPDYFAGFDEVLDQFSLEDWQSYLKFKVLVARAEYLPQAFVDLDFEFFGKVLSGSQEIRPRWKRAVGTVDDAAGELVGKVYVERHFNSEAKARMEALVDNLRATVKERLEGLEWMSAETKKQALAKLALFNAKIGYPDKWRDYSGLKIDKDDLVGNVIRAENFLNQRNLDKLGKPIDRDEWFMTPQMVNAYYNANMNEIVFPAAILQPPFFNMQADDAVNYGGIGAVIGHEISHGFDDQGRKSDGYGNLRDWWTEQDATEFQARAQLMVDQYNAFEPLPGANVNGQLTLGENIGDLAGLTMAYYAYKRSLGGKPAPVLDGFTGEQRLFIGWAQVWRLVEREESLRRNLLTDPHAPAECRVLGTLSNMPEFYEAFNLTDKDKMFRPDASRVKIW